MDKKIIGIGIYFPIFSNYFIFCTLHFVCGWHNLKTAENSRLETQLSNIKPCLLSLHSVLRGT